MSVLGGGIRFGRGAGSAFRSGRGLEKKEKGLEKKEKGDGGVSLGGGRGRGRGRGRLGGAAGMGRGRRQAEGIMGVYSEHVMQEVDDGL